MRGAERSGEQPRSDATKQSGADWRWIVRELSTARPGPSAEARTKRPTPPELPYAACFAAVSGAQSRENEASCAGARPDAVYVYSKRSRYAQIARCRGRATLRRNMPHVGKQGKQRKQHRSQNHFPVSRGRGTRAARQGAAPSHSHAAKVKGVRTTWRTRSHTR